MALDRRIVELYDEYTHKPLDRRVFMNRLLAIAGTAAAAEAALALLEPNYAHAQQVAPDDARITASRFGQTVDGVALKGYLVTPKAEAKRGGVLVIHENRGLNPHIEDITRRMALEGFTALGLDFLTPLGGTPTDPDAARALFPQLPAEAVGLDHRDVHAGLREPVRRGEARDAPADDGDVLPHRAGTTGARAAMLLLMGIPMLADYLEALRDGIAALAVGGHAAVADEIAEHCSTLGEEVSVSLPAPASEAGEPGGDVDTTLRGVAVRLDASGGLVVQSAGVERIVNAGDVVHVR